MTHSPKENKVTESLLTRLWKSRLLKKEALLSTGRKVQVVYPGRENQDSGPDFLGAIISNEEGALLHGDVELHVRSRDWRAHGHQVNPSYNGVILQVTMWDNGKTSSYLQSGEAIPTLSLSSCLGKSIKELTETVQLPLLPAEPCAQAIERLGSEAVGKALDKAGLERFRLQADGFYQELSIKGGAQVLYEGIMSALGYSRNKQPFQELAGKLPLEIAESFTKHQTSPRCNLILQALFLGTAGLLPRQRLKRNGVEDKAARELEYLWSCLGKNKEMEEASWHFLKVRPENFPTRRLVAISSLLTKYKDVGLFQGMLRLIKQASLENCRSLEQGLSAHASGYWTGHFDFGVETGRRSPILIGQQRAREIVVNILLPFFFAWAERTFQSELKDRIYQLYQGYPRTGENRITRRMVKQVFGLSHCNIVNSATRQQGLIHLHKNFCVLRKCAECPLG